MGVFVFAMAGASGAPYARRVLEQMLLAGHDVKAVITDAGRKVLEVEERLVLTGNTGTDTPVVIEWARATAAPGKLELYHQKDVASPIASGSYRTWYIERTTRTGCRCLLERAPSPDSGASRDAVELDSPTKHDSCYRGWRYCAACLAGFLPQPQWHRRSDRHGCRAHPLFAGNRFTCHETMARS